MSQYFRAKGMTCRGDVAAVSRAMQSVAPHTEISVDLKSERVDVHGDADPRALVAAIEGAGFSVQPSRRAMRMRSDTIWHAARRCLAALACVSLLGLVLPRAWAGQHVLSPPQADAVRQIVREYLINNPEVILEAVETLKRREEAGTEAKVQRALQERRDELLNDSDSPVGGNPQGDVTLVEFFDYRCPYCKRVHPSIQALLREDRNLRFVYKEWPILGAESVFAARAALAARAQGKYHAFHGALMDARSTLTESAVLAAAKNAGLDVDQLKRDIAVQKESTDASFTRTSDLAAALDIRGTPAFVVGNLVIRGASGMEDLRKVIADVRSRRAR